MEFSQTHDVAERGRHRVRVLFVPQWYPLKDRNKTTGVFCREHVHAAALYDDIAVLVFASGSQCWPSLRWERRNDDGVPTFAATFGRSPIPHTTLPFFHLHLRRAIKRAIDQWGRPEVIHTQDSYAHPVMKAAQHLGIPFVISQHWTGFMRGKLGKRTIQRFRWAFSNAARVLPANQFAAEDYARYGIKASVTWLPNALNIEVFYPGRQLDRESWLLHVSGFTSQKRFPDVVDAFASALNQHPKAVLHVVGDGPERKKMEALSARELPMGSFCFHGFLAKPDLADLMRCSAGFVLPSEAETFGCVLMEAMACGCPVLTTRVGGIPAVVRDGEGLFVEVGNIDEIAQGMIRLLSGSHGLDLKRISDQTRDRFSYTAVGRILHEEHLSACLVRS
jgi:glycosyltransferase involved in cell wall biosynthesis